MSLLNSNNNQNNSGNNNYVPVHYFCRTDGKNIPIPYEKIINTSNIKIVDANTGEVLNDIPVWGQKKSHNDDTYHGVVYVPELNIASAHNAHMNSYVHKQQIHFNGSEPAPAYFNQNNSSSTLNVTSRRRRYDNY